jgi:recombination protein RecT
MTQSSAIIRRPFDVASDMLAKSRPVFEILLAPFSPRADLAAARAIRVVQDALARTPFLLECTPQSIVRSAIHASELGLELGTPLGHAYLVPFYNSKKRRREAQCIPGYKGLITLAYDDPRIVGVRADHIHEHDEYEEIGGTNPELIHKPKRFEPRGALQGVYGAVQIRDGWPIFRVADVPYLETIKASSLDKMKEQWQRDASPWVKHEPEMQLKTALRLTLKAVPLGTRLRRALELDAQEYGEKPSDPRGHADELRTKLGDAAQVIDAEVIDDE